VKKKVTFSEGKKESMVRYDDNRRDKERFKLGYWKKEVVKEIKIMKEERIGSETEKMGEESDGRKV